MVVGRRLFYAEDLAYVHHAGYTAFSRTAAPAILARLHAAQIDRGLVVELGCGSGVLARILSSTGYQVLGIDASASMLAIARRVAPRARFEQARIEDATLPPCDAVISLGEGLAYLKSTRRRSLRPLFHRLARVLRPGGLLIFDLLVRGGGPLMNYRTWRAADDWTVLVDSRERSTTLIRDITTFRARGDLFRRSEERHHAAVHAREDVIEWLRSAGFRTMVRRGYGPAALPPRRLAFIAKRIAK